MLLHAKKLPNYIPLLHIRKFFEIYIRVVFMKLDFFLYTRNKITQDAK